MNVNETRELLSALKSAGATHFKSADFEVTFTSTGDVNSVGSGLVKWLPETKSQDDGITPAPAATDQDVSAVHNVEATAKIQDLIKTLSLPNEQLVDRIFPNGAGG